MENKYQNTFRRSSNRAQWWNYSNNGTYFITICTKDHKHYFGEVNNGEMILNTLGENVIKCWNAIPMFHPYAEIDAFIVMPNHIHGILHINNQNSTIQDNTNTTTFKITSKSLGSIIRGFKTGVKKEAFSQNIELYWQANYHDHIIQNAESYQKIHNYIINNPLVWKDDKFYNE